MKNGIDFDFKYKCDQYEAHVKLTSLESEIWVSTTQTFADGRCVVHGPVEVNRTDSLAAIVSSVNGLSVGHDMLSDLLKFLSQKTVDMCGIDFADESSLSFNRKLHDAVNDSIDISNFSAFIFGKPKEVN